MKSSNNKILTIAVLLLLLVNIALVAFILMGKNRNDKWHSGGKGDPFETMVKRWETSDS